MQEVVWVADMLAQPLQRRVERRLDSLDHHLWVCPGVGKRKVRVVRHARAERVGGNLLWRRRECQVADEVVQGVEGAVFVCGIKWLLRRPWGGGGGEQCAGGDRPGVGAEWTDGRDKRRGR